MPQAISQPDIDRETLVARLESSQERLLRMVADVPERLCAVNLAENCWSIRDVVEHLVLCEYRFMGRVQNAEVNTGVPDYEKDAAVHSRGLDRSQKRQAPEQVIPSGQFATLAWAIGAFKDARRQTIEFVRGGSDDLRRLKAQGPLGDMDGYQVLLLTALHTERHVLQIDEIKNDPAFGK